MSSYLIKSGIKIKLLHPAVPPEEDQCTKCLVKFNPNANMRACFDLCGHLACLPCIVEMHGCEDCAAIAADSSKITGQHDAPTSLPQPIFVISSVLGRSAEDEANEDSFPRIKQLSVYMLPVLQYKPPVTEPIVIDLAQDDDETLTPGNLHQDLLPSSNSEPTIKGSDCDSIFYTKSILKNHMQKNHDRHESKQRLKARKLIYAKQEQVDSSKYPLSQQMKLKHIPEPIQSVRMENILKKSSRNVTTPSISAGLEEKKKRTTRGNHANEIPDKVAIQEGIHIRGKNSKLQLNKLNQNAFNRVDKLSSRNSKHLNGHKKCVQITNPPFECAICKTKIHRQFTFERHMQNLHGIRITLHPDETPEDGVEYCPECQSDLGAERCTKVAYSKCGHISCLACLIKVELKCGQCTTENAPNVHKTKNRMQRCLKGNN